VLDNSWRANYSQALKLETKWNTIRNNYKWKGDIRKENNYLLRKLSDISEPNTICIKDVDNNNKGIETTENWYFHIPKPVCQHEGITVLWNQGVQTDREVLANRPDIIKKDKVCLLIDVAIPSGRNVIQKESEKKLKYKNSSIEIQQMWNMEWFVIPVIIRATGIVTKALKNIWKQYQESIQ
jgi:hypothetical protein